VTTWLKNNENIIIVGKEGCGKSILLEASINELEKTEKCKLVTLHCNRETKSSQLIKKLYQSCQKVTTANGKTLKPSNCSKQIFILK
jgi:dynein heavy chain 2